MRPRTIPTVPSPIRIAAVSTAALAAVLSLGLAGCSAPQHPPAASPASIAPSAPPSDDPAPSDPAGTVPSGEPVEPAWADPVAAEAAETAGDWLEIWDESACTGARAADDERYCQLLLMDLASHAGGTASTLAEYAAVVPELAEVARLANDVSAAADAWLGAWCGAYADPACAAPGEALAEAERALAAALDPWRERATPDA
ncbi:hypothetical protein ACWKWP_06245 [Agromyces soli]